MTAEVPAGLEAGGRALWERATAAKGMHPGELVVLEEACRVKDRLDLFHLLLIGDRGAWAELRGAEDDDGVKVLVVGSAVTEARLHAGELRQLIEKLRLPFEVAGAKPAEVVDDVAARRARRSGRRAAGAAGL